MRVTETVDYNHVQANHQAIHARLNNWRRWVTVADVLAAMKTTT